MTPETTQPANVAAPGNHGPRRVRPTRVGVVTSSARNKTIRVTVSYMVRHPKYGKFLRRRTVLHAHDEKNECHDGDRVEVMMCRPISKTKSWRLVRVLDRAPREKGAQA